MTERARIARFEVELDQKAGIQRYNGAPALTLWIESSLLGLVCGMQRMVGTERFNISMQAGGRESVEGDWEVITAAPTFEQGFASIAELAAACGWGRWTLLRLDREKKEACFRIENSWETIYQKKLGVTWGSSYMAGKFAGLCTKLFGVNCWAEQTEYATAGDAFDAFVVRPSEATIEAQMDDLLRSDQATRADLAVALERLRREVEERRATEHDLREKLALIKRQEEAISALSTPILKVWDSVLALPLIGVVDSQRAAAMMERVLDEIIETRSRYLILDLTGVEIIDTSTADHIIKIVRAVELLGARSVITGIRPAVAQTMTSLGVDLSKMETVRNLQEGIKRCIRWSSDAGEKKGGGSARGG